MSRNERPVLTWPWDPWARAAAWRVTEAAHRSREDRTGGRVEGSLGPSLCACSGKTATTHPGHREAWQMQTGSPWSLAFPGHQGLCGAELGGQERSASARRPTARWLWDSRRHSGLSISSQRGRGGKLQHGEGASTLGMVGWLGGQVAPRSADLTV